MKLALGTAQIGLDYGVSNNSGQVSLEEAEQLLAQAEHFNIGILDTAAVYGNSEATLGQLANSNFKIITKLAIDTHSPVNIGPLFEESLRKLQRKSIYGVLLHDAEVLNSNYSHHIASQINTLKVSGLVKKVGLSLYHPQQTKLFDILQPDIVQIPLNLLDQRFLQNGLLAQLKAQGIEIHVRSAFLQGLLLMQPETRSAYFSQFNELKAVEQLFKTSQYNRLDTCLNFLKSISEIDHVVVGCCSANELVQIHTAWHKDFEASYHHLSSVDDALIIPSNWPK